MLQQNLLMLTYFSFSNLCVIVLLTKILTLGILFSTALREVLVAKLVILGISPVTLIALTLRVVLLAKLVISGILSSIFLI